MQQTAPSLRRPRNPSGKVSPPREGAGSYADEPSFTASSETGHTGHTTFRPYRNGLPVHDYGTQEGRSGWKAIADRNVRDAELEWGPPPRISLREAELLGRLSVPDTRSCRMEVGEKEDDAVNDLETIKAQYKNAGFYLEQAKRSGHWKVYDKPPGQPNRRLMTTLALTPSDWRNQRNSKATLRRLVREQQKPPEAVFMPAEVPNSSTDLPRVGTNQIAGSAYRLWYWLRQDAEAMGRRTRREGQDGWLRSGALREAARRVWPALPEDPASNVVRNAMSALSEYLRLTGNLDNVTRGSGLTGEPPVWWVRENYKHGPASLYTARGDAARETGGEQAARKAQQRTAPAPGPVKSKYSPYTVGRVRDAIVEVTGGKEGRFTSRQVMDALPGMNDTQVSAILAHLDRKDGEPVTRTGLGRYYYSPVTVSRREPSPADLRAASEALKERKTMPAAVRDGRLRFKVLDVLKAHPGQGMSIEQVSDEAKTVRSSTATALRRWSLTPQAHVTNPQSGWYVYEDPAEGRIEVTARAKKPEPVAPETPEPPAPVAPPPAAPGPHRARNVEVVRQPEPAQPAAGKSIEVGDMLEVVRITRHGDIIAVDQNGNIHELYE